MAEHFFIYNNQFYPEGAPVVSSGNRSLRYGDGLFETMKMINGKIINKEYHFERLFHGLTMLRFAVQENMDKYFFEKKINELVIKNGHEKAARIRLMLFRGDSGIFDFASNLPGYLIETFGINEEFRLNDKGLVVDIFPDARKSIDSFSNIKTNNYLPYIMAALYAKENELDDCLILNSYERICDSTIANVFIVKDKKIYTPPLSEACVAGVTRRSLLKREIFNKYIFIEKPLSDDELLLADELFLTNSIYHIRWVKKFRHKIYNNNIIKEIYKSLLQTIVE